jgi:hypothetical protein
VFAARGIAVEWFDYGHLPPYPQLHGPYDPHVSILDTLLMAGADAAALVCRSRIAPGP